MAVPATPTALGAIQAAAKARGLAWAPLAAVAHYESGLDPANIGDGGHAFGLFQNNNAGGTITGDPNPRRFLNPTVSANYTADAVKRLGIQGLPPAQQVAAIVNRYERPAKPGPEIAGAQQYLATLGQSGATTPQVTAPLAAAGAGSPTAIGSLPALSLAPLQAGLGLQQTQNQRALDALGKISGRNVQDAAAPDLSALTSSQTTQLQPTAQRPQPTTVSIAPGSKTPAGLDPQAAKAVELARTYLGDKYVFGGSSHAGIDCSGLITNIYAKLGINLPHNAAAQYHLGKPVAEKDLQPGDAVYFQTEGAKAGVTHVALFVGNGQVLEAPHTGAVVHITPLAGYLQQHLVGARRFA